MKLRMRGYTLIEVLISSLLIAILSSITIPNFAHFLAQSRLDNAMSRILKSLHLARGYAVTYSTNITICPLVSGSCQKNWQGTIYAFEDSNRNLSLDESEYTITVVEKIDSQDELTYPRKAITYRADGSINFMQSGSFIYCNTTYPELTGNRITVSQVGRVRIKDSDKCETPSL